MIKETERMLEIIQGKRTEERKKVAEATGRILLDLNGSYIELDCSGHALDEANEAVAQIIKQVIASDTRVKKRANR